MEVTELKEKLHSLIENSTEETLEYMYALFEERDYTDEFKGTLDDEYDAYQKDKAGDTKDHVNALISELLKK